MSSTISMSTNISGGDKVAWAVWVTGLPGSGKSAVADGMARIIREKGLHVKVLELDFIRRVLTPKPTYSEEERTIVYAALAYMAKLLVDEGVNVIIDATGNLAKYRDIARILIHDYGEIYVKCPIEICMAREASRKNSHAPGGIYKKGISGQSHTVPGLNVPYEPPGHPIAVIDTEHLDQAHAADEAASAVLAWAGEHNG